MEEELDFAGHPVIGAACVLHEQRAQDQPMAHWHFHLNAGSIPVTTRRQTHGYTATMEQGTPTFGTIPSQELQEQILQTLNLVPKYLDETLPMQVVSTGLPYLLVILKQGLEQARIIHPDLESLLAQIGAKFVYVFDLPTMEGRTWDNTGRVEDIATGSAGGPTGAYLVRYGKAQANQPLIIHQGSFVGRPSEITVLIAGTTDAITSVQVSGDVTMVAAGTINASTTF